MNCFITFHLLFEELLLGVRSPGKILRSYLMEAMVFGPHPFLGLHISYIFHNLAQEGHTKSVLAQTNRYGHVYFRLVNKYML